jgi:hypothetical protein
MIATRCDNEGCLGASVFFFHGSGELETTCKFVTSIAVQMARRFRRLGAPPQPPPRTHPCFFPNQMSSANALHRGTASASPSTAAATATLSGLML